MTFRPPKCLPVFALGLAFACQLAAANEASGIIAAVRQLGPATALVVDDTTFFVSPATEIDRLNGHTASSDDLVEGRKIRFQYDVNEQGTRYLIRITILSGTKANR